MLLGRGGRWKVKFNIRTKCFSSSSISFSLSLFSHPHTEYAAVVFLTIAQLNRFVFRSLWNGQWWPLRPPGRNSFVKFYFVRSSKQTTHCKAIPVNAAFAEIHWKRWAVEEICRVGRRCRMTGGGYKTNFGNYTYFMHSEMRIRIRWNLIMK